MLNATVTRIIAVTPELLRIFVRPDVPYKGFLAGQYVALGLPGSYARPAHFPPEESPPDPDKLVKRAYSIGSSPQDPSELEFYVAILPQGALTARLAALKAGDRVYAAPKITGTFTLEGLPQGSNLVLVSTGTGIAPFISMLKAPGTIIPGREITLVHGVRYVRDLGYREEILSLCGEFPSLRYYTVVSREEPAPSLNSRRGHVQKLFADGVIALDPARDHVFLCGNPAMIDEMEQNLTAQGYREHSRKSPGNLHLERYW